MTDSQKIQLPQNDNNDKEEKILFSAEEEDTTVIMPGNAEKTEPENVRPDSPAHPLNSGKDASVSTETTIISAEGENRKQLKISCHGCSQKLDVTFLNPFATFECPTCQTELIVPKWFDNYLLEEPGGEGGMATVYRALDVALDREVALKILKPKVASKKERRDLFLHEARTSATINHYAVIPIFTCGEYEEQPYIVMQYMNGGSLEDTLKAEKENLPIEKVIKWINDCAEGLDNAKRHGIIHHDIKPGNIMLDSDNNAKIGDFGIAQAINDSRTEKIMEISKSWISPHYVSPEKVEDGTENHQGDIYSLGASFYHLITGKTPFNKEDINDLIRARLHEVPIPPRQIRPEIPEEISDLILAMMARNPEDRPGYRQIIKILNSRRQTTKNIATQAPENEEPQEPGKDIEKTEANSKIKTALLSLAALIILSGCAFALWYYGVPGLFENGSATANIEIPIDCLPEITAEIEKGNSSKATNMALEIISNDEESISAKKQAALFLAFSSFLNASPDAHKNCSLSVEKLLAAKIDETDPVLALIRFMQKPEISEEVLEIRFEDEKFMRPLSSLAIFLRRTYSGKPKETLKSSLKKYLSSVSEAPAGYWGNAWKKRSSIWGKSIIDGQNDSMELEPLIARIGSPAPPVSLKKQFPPQKTKPKTAELTDTKIINANWLKKHRPRRPGSKGCDFTGTLPSEYLGKLPPQTSEKEKIRYRMLSESIAYLSTQLMRIPLSINQFPMKGKNKQFKGYISSDGSQPLFLENGRTMKIQWDMISPGQSAMLLSRIARNHLRAGITDPKLKYKAAGDYMRAALLCDWKGNYPEAVKYIRKAEKTDPAIKKEIKKYFID